jgi:hypothetical protein
MMDMLSINLVVKDLDAALKAHLKFFGTNNVQEVLKVTGLNDGNEVVDGYLLKTQPLNLGLYTPRGTEGRMGKYLQKTGEGIHHLTFQMKQEEFEQTYTRFKKEGKKVSDKVSYLGRLSEGVFWLDGSGEQGVPMQFVAKCNIGLGVWEETNYLDSPKTVQHVNITEEYIRPRTVLSSVMVTVSESEKQKEIWADILGREPVETGDIFRLGPGRVDDGRGNIFIPIRFGFNDS